ncbi:CPBP family glutamic-type intramembrane protease [Hydrogenivirga sp.]
MHKRLLAYGGLLAVLLVSKLFPQLDFLPFLYMLIPMIFVPDNELGFKNYGRGVLYGSALLPLLLILPPDLSCPAWILNQLGIAAAEEVFFRGFIMTALGNLKTSLLFSLAHLVHFPTLNSLLVFFPSLLFGYAMQRSGSILAPIGLHFTANLFYSSLVKEFPQLYHLLQRQLTGG